MAKRQDVTTLLAVAAAAAMATSFAGASAQAATVKDVFEKYKLIGTFSYDCTKPADKRNFYYVDRVIDADHVQRDQMSGPTTRDFALIIDQAEELKPNELRISGKHVEDGLAVVAVWHIEPNRTLTRQSTRNGQPFIRDGILLSNNYRIPFLNRCGD